MTIYEAKEQTVVPPIAILVDLLLVDGTMLRWASMKCQYQSNDYSVRISGEHLSQWRLSEEVTNDGNNSCALILGDADGYISGLVRAGLLRGSYAKVFLGSCQSGVVLDRSAFVAGIIDRSSEGDSKSVTISITNRLNASRAHFPPMRIQKRCSWLFPKTLSERSRAMSSGEEGRYSNLFRCGYSADIEGGVGNLINSVPYSDCDYSRAACEERGMFSEDALGRPTRRFSGIEFIPASVLVRGHGESAGRLSNIVSLDARFNDVVPAVYGTGWLQAPVVFSRNDGNLTFGEVLLGLGEIERVIKVLVNGYEVPLAIDGRNMTGSGWHRLVSQGNRTGTFNGEFAQSSGAPAGDPYGSLAVLSVAVPNSISDGKSSLKVEVLLDGIKLPVLDASGTLESYGHSRNPAWVICDILRRTGWGLSELDLESFRRTASYCDEIISVPDANGNLVNVPRFAVNLVLKRRYSVGELLRGIRLAAQIRVTLNRDGRVGLRVECDLATEQPIKPEGSNSIESINSGWPAYNFGDGSNSSGGILLNERHEPEFRMYSKPGVDSVNRVSFELQDSLNEFRQDSISVVDTEDAQLRRTEVAQNLPVLGVPNFSQALRICQTWLNKSIAGNVYVSFRTTIRGIHLRPGELISLNYPRFGLDNVIFRVNEIQLSSDLQKMQVLCQLHKDEWYSDNPLLRYDSSRIYSWGNRSVRAVCGSSLTGGAISFDTQERLALDPFGVEKAEVTVRFTRPSSKTAINLNSPLVTFEYETFATGGALENGTYFYATTAVDSSGLESQLSSLIQVKVGGITATNRVLLKNIKASSGASGFNLYRGTSPKALVRVGTNRPVSEDLIDTGTETELALPPDEKYLYLQLYWRRELLGPTRVMLNSAKTIGNPALQLNPGEWVGKRVSICGGTGLGQERLIVANTATTIDVDQAWLVQPDLTSEFCLVETNWQKGERSDSNEIKVYLPPWGGDTFQINLRSVGNDLSELDPIESPLIRWRLGVGNSESGEDGAPPMPFFGLSLLQGGIIRFGGLGFEAPKNLQSVFAGLLKLWFWDELTSPTSAFVSASCDDAATTLTIAGLSTTLPPVSLLQIENEVVEIVDVAPGVGVYEVVRGRFGTAPAPHAENVPCFPLDQRSIPIAFLPGFLNSTAGTSFAYTLSLPNVRVACASFELYNRLGKSPVCEANFVASIDAGMRTLSGGQVVLGTQGYLSIEAAAGAPVTVDRALVVRDLFAIIEEAPIGGDIAVVVRVNGDPYAELLIPAGQLSSDAVNQFNASPIPVGARLNFDIVSVPPASVGASGRDLSVVIRT